MKKTVSLSLFFSLISSQTFATKARMEALGQDGLRGSQYLHDSRNIFRNPGLLSTIKNSVVTEWGDFGAGSPLPEGGFFASTDSFNYGLYLGADHRTPALKEFVNNQALSYTADFTPQNNSYRPGNQLDFFFAGGSTIAWGIRGNYSSGEDENQKEKTQIIGLGFGLILEGFQTYLNLDLVDEREDLTVPANSKEYAGNLGLQIGGSYQIDSLTLFLDILKQGADYSESSFRGRNAAETVMATLGLAHKQQISTVAFVFGAVDYRHQKWENENNLGAIATQSWKRTDNDLILTAGFETPATDWLTWRGSFSQSVFVNKTKIAGTSQIPAIVNNKSFTTSNSTEVAAGASLTFGKLVIDGTLSGTSASKLNFDEVLSQVAITYMF